MNATNNLKTIPLNEIKDRFIGKPGSESRDKYEVELTLDVAGHLIRELRMARNLTQSQLGEMVGVQKAQISRIETNMKSINLSTLIKVLDAMEAKVRLSIELPVR